MRSRAAAARVQQQGAATPAVRPVPRAAERLTEALIENELRAELDPLHRAKAFQALLEQGLTVRGIAERLGGTSGRRSRETRIKEHLQILTLPEQLQQKLAEGEIPLLAVKALGELNNIHPELAQATLRAVEPANDYEEPYSWSDVADAPLQAALSSCEQLPDGIYLSRESYPLERFTLSEQAQADLAVLAEHGRAPSEIRFTGELIEHARALGAVHESGWTQLIAGQDVADTLAGEWLAAARKHAEQQPAREATARAGGEQEDTGSPGPERERAAAERDRERERREQAAAYNLRLGVLAFKHLARVKVDERVLRILTSVELAGSLRAIAARGARLTAPGWVTETEQKNGRTKTGYLEAHESTEKAREFLAGATGAAEIAGRALTLLTLAAHADEDALAPSARSYYELHFTGPWGGQARSDLAELIAERVKPGELQALDERLGRHTDAS